MLKISIVIPIYNKEQYIVDCINSVIKQTMFQEIELLLINDGSFDNSEAICINYSNKYPNIKYSFQENKGVSITRNNGLKMAKGEYVFFMDADDTIEENFIENSYKNAIANNSDLVIVSNNVGFGNVKLDIISYLATWQCFWKKSFLCEHKDISFVENLSNGEDGLFSFMLLNFTDKISVEENSFYYYRDSVNSLDKKLKDSEYYVQIIDRWLDILQDFYDSYKNEQKLNSHLLRFLCCHIFYRLIKDSFSYKQRVKVLNRLSIFILHNKLPFLKFNVSKLKYNYSYLYIIFNMLILYAYIFKKFIV